MADDKSATSEAGESRKLEQAATDTVKLANATLQDKLGKDTPEADKLQKISDHILSNDKSIKTRADQLREVVGENPTSEDIHALEHRLKEQLKEYDKNALKDALRGPKPDQLTLPWPFGSATKPESLRDKSNENKK
jgi:hypothetical protein